jgi:signal transduction histidine kinase
MNLLSNAIKYGKGDPVELAVRRDGDHAVLSVRDHGIGIAHADHERIFHRFERAVSARNFGGMGLGLWITKELVEMHDGTIHVDSELGQGATFVVRLPIATE